MKRPTIALLPVTGRCSQATLQWAPAMLQKGELHQGHHTNHLDDYPAGIYSLILATDKGITVKKQ